MENEHRAFVMELLEIAEKELFAAAPSRCRDARARGHREADPENGAIGVAVAATDGPAMPGRLVGKGRLVHRDGDVGSENPPLIHPG